MKQRGRKSVSKQIASPVVLEQKRPAPPESLNESMAATWIKVTSCYPPEHFRPDTQPLLELYCRHIFAAHMLEVEIDRYKPDWLKDMEALQRYKLLLDMREKETRTVMALARSMRLTHQAQYSTKKAATIAEKVPTGERLWDYEGK